MNLINDILKQLGEVEYFRQRKSMRLERDGAILFLKYAGYGPAGGHVLHLMYSSEREEVEMHFEKRALCWLPYYLRDSKAEAEVFLYEFVDARLPLRMDFDAGSYLIQRACFLELILRAHGFDRLDDDCLYHPLFSRRAS